MLLVPKTAASAKNRFIWYPDRLNQLPSSLSGLPKLLRLPVMKGIIPELLRDLRTPSRFFRPKSESPAEVERKARRELLEDESVESFITRRNRGSKLAQNVISAVIHGIYAGDIRRLSVRSLLGFLWETERTHGSLMRRFLMPTWLNSRYRPPCPEQVALKQWEGKALDKAKGLLGPEAIEQIKKISVYSFPQGVQELTDAMMEELRSAENVEVQTGVSCEAVTLNQDQSIEITTSSGKITCSRVISALPATVLNDRLSPQLPSNYLTGGAMATVGVVNLAIPSWLYAPRPRLLSIEGFGFLVPRSVQPNKDGILGIVFDSDSITEQDYAPNGTAETGPTKFTVMMGGAHWQDLSKDQLPGEEKMIAAAKKAVSKCLGVEMKLLDDPGTMVRAKMQYDCIPWYTVGHPVRMARLHRAILDGNQSGEAGSQEQSWKGKLALVGASYTGVSVNDCVARAGETMQKIVDEELNGEEKNVTGLEILALQCGML